MTIASILIRTFNEEKHLGSLLVAIRKQDCQDYEIVLVDSGSTDRTLEIAESNGCDQIHHIESRNFTFGYSLNVGCAASNGDFIAIVSAHAIPIREDWLSILIRPFSDDSIAMVYGRHVGADETKFSERRDFERLFGDSPKKSSSPGFYANNANSSIRRSLWLEHPFDDYLTGLEDIAWARHHMQKGHNVVYEPGAAVHHIHEESWHQVYNRYRREAVAAKRIGLPEPPHAAPRLTFFVGNLAADLLARRKVEPKPAAREIFQFRLNQWKGACEGWAHDINLEAERSELFFSETNEAVVISGRHDARLENLPMPEIEPGDVLVKVAYVGVCKTDLEIHEQTLGYYKHGQARYPIVPGHEYSGQVVSVGANSGGIKLHDRVVGECILPCGRCEACSNGRSGGCSQRREVGVVNWNGACARYMVVPANRVHRIPDEVDLRSACLTEPLAVVGKALRRIDGIPREGRRTVGIIGAGPIGHFAAQVLALAGEDVEVFDRNPARLSLLPAGVTTSTEVRRLSKFDVIIEATGDLESLKTVLEGSRADSAVLLLGFPYGSLNFDFESLVARERFVVGSVGSESRDFDWALKTLPDLDTRALTSTTVPLRDFARAWEMHRKGTQLKVIIEVEPETLKERAS